MARIPRAQELGLGDEAAQTTRGVVNVPTIDQSGLRAGAAALDQVGDQILRTNNNFLEFGKRLQKAQIDRSVAEANIGLADDLDKLKRRLTDSGDDPTTFEKTYDEESKKLIDGWGQKVPGGGRDPWMQRAQGYQVDGKIAVRNLMRQRQLEGEQAKSIAIIESIKDRAGATDLSPEAYGEMQTQGRQLVADQLATGVITKDVAQRYLVELDNARVNDMATRWTNDVTALAEQGLFDIAEGALAEGVKDGVPKAYVEDAKSSIVRAKSRIEKERNERMNVNDANFQVDVMAGKAGYRHVDEAIARGELDPSRRDTLYRVVREEDDRRKREAEVAKMSPAEKERLADISKDNLLAFEMLSQENAPNFIGDPAQWSEGYRQAYNQMTPDDQRAVLKMRNEMAVKGRSANYVTSVLGDVMSEAKRFAPSLMDEKTNKDGYVKLQGILFANAKKLADENVGKPISADQARKAVLQSLGSYDQKKYGAGANMAIGFDADVYRRVVAELTARQGGPPTNDQALAAYNAVMAD